MYEACEITREGSYPGSTYEKRSLAGLKLRFYSIQVTFLLYYYYYYHGMNFVNIVFVNSLWVIKGMNSTLILIRRHVAVTMRLIPASNWTLLRNVQNDVMISKNAASSITTLNNGAVCMRHATQHARQAIRDQLTQNEAFQVWNSGFIQLN